MHTNVRNRNMTIILYRCDTVEIIERGGGKGKTRGGWEVLKSIYLRGLIDDNWVIILI